jgi:hypothetical protein
MRSITRDSLPHLFATARDTFRGRIHTVACRALARWWGIGIGPGCRFYGVPIMRRFPGSRIQVGARCQFRSAPWSNLIGLARPCYLSTLSERAVITIAEGCGFSGTVIGAAERIEIGRNVFCGGNVTITDTDWHPVNPQARINGDAGLAAPVVIGDRVWLSMNVIVLKGVTIGAETVVAAGSVVSRSLPGGVLAGGSPAKVICELKQ